MTEADMKCDECGWRCEERVAISGNKSVCRLCWDIWVCNENLLSGVDAKTYVENQRLWEKLVRLRAERFFMTCGQVTGVSGTRKK